MNWGIRCCCWWATCSCRQPASATLGHSQVREQDRHFHPLNCSSDEGNVVCRSLRLEVHHHLIMLVPR